MLGFDAEERLIQKLPQDFAGKVVWGSRYPHHDATSAWDALARCAAPRAGAADRAHDGRQRRRAVRSGGGGAGAALASSPHGVRAGMSVETMRKVTGYCGFSTLCRVVKAAACASS